MVKKVASNNVTVSIDNKSGTLKDITSQIREIDGIDRLWNLEDVTAFSASEMRQFKVFPAGAEVTLRGMHDTGSSAADAFYRDLVNLQGTSAVLTLEIKPDGTRLFSFEGFVSRYSYILRNKQIVGFEAVHVSDTEPKYAATT